MGAGSPAGLHSGGGRNRIENEYSASILPVDHGTDSRRGPVAGVTRHGDLRYPPIPLNISP